ncbi:MAG: integrase core domain-containing protein [Gammaproteobacteria bacterium]|nr:integrase core domain-containing protein [Gammaproteobacteria bacterium]
MTQGKIERYHRSMKNIILLDNYYTPEELENRIAEWVDYYNYNRYHESIENIIPADKYYSRADHILRRIMKLKFDTLRKRRKRNLRRAN